MSTAGALQMRVNLNAEIIDIFSASDLVDAWQNTTGKKVSALAGQTTQFVANYSAAALDIATTTKMINDLGIDGKVIIKSVSGKQYVIFKGYAGNRSIFTASRYLATNPKVVDMAIGTVGVNRSIVSGARLTIFLVVPANVLSHILNDQSTMSSLIGSTATDLIKVGAAAAISSIVASAAGTLTTLTAGPVIVAIAVGVATALTLNALDQKFGVTRALTQYLDELHNSTAGQVGRDMIRLEKRLKWQILNGRRVGEGIFY